MVTESTDLFQGFSDTISDIEKVEGFLLSLQDRLTIHPITGIEFEPMLLTACTFLTEALTSMRAHYEMTRKV